MIILASAIILSLSSSGIIGKANKAVTDTNKANLLDAANLAAGEYELKVNTGENVTETLSEYVKSRLATQGFTEEQIAKLKISDDTKKIEYIGESSTASTVHNGTIPEGGTYYVSVGETNANDFSNATATYTAGNEFPETITHSDAYVYDGYEYRYGGLVYNESLGWYLNADAEEAWYYAKVEDNAGTLLTEINGKPVVVD